MLDRVLIPDLPLDEAAKCALVSMDSTLKSNLSVGLPLDLAVYEEGQLACDKLVCIDEHNPYFNMLCNNWGERLRAVFDSIEDPQWFGGDSPVPLVTGSTKAIKKITTPEEKLI